MHEAHSLILKTWSTGQDLIPHTSRGLLADGYLFHILPLPPSSQQVLSLFSFFFLSLSLFFFPLVGTIYMSSLCLIPASGRHLGALPLPHSRASVFPGGELCHVSGAPGFVAATQGTPLDHLALGSGVLMILSAMGQYQSEREFLAGYQPWGTAQTAYRDTLQSFSQKGLFTGACPGALVWGAGFWFGTQLEANRGALGEWRLMNIIFALFLCPATAQRISPRQTYAHLVPCFLQLAARGHLYIA